LAIDYDIMQITWA